MVKEGKKYYIVRTPDDRSYYEENFWPAAVVSSVFLSAMRLRYDKDTYQHTNSFPLYAYRC